METRAKYITIGVFTLVVMAMGFAFVYWLNRLSETGIRTTILFEFEGSVSGLAPGSAVHFAGIRVGNVTGMAFDHNDPNKVIVTAEVREDTPIKTDTRAEIGMNLLTGIASVDMSGGSPDAPSIFTKDPPKIVGSRSGMSDVVAQVGSAVTKVEQIVDRVDRLLTQNETSITRTVENVETFTAALAANSDGVSDLLDNVSALSETVGSLSQRLDSLVGQADDVLAAIDPGEVRDMIEDTSSFMSRLANASGRIEMLLGDITVAVQSVTEFVNSLSTTLANVQDVVTSVDREKLTLAVENLSDFSESVKAATPDLDSMIDEARQTIANAEEFTASLNAKEEDFNQIIANARSLSERLNQSAGRLDSVLGKADDLLSTDDAEGTRNFFQEASSAARAIRETAETMTRQTNRVGEGLADFSTRGLADIAALVNELRASVARIDRTISRISADPAGALFGGGSDVRDYNRR